MKQILTLLKTNMLNCLILSCFIFLTSINSQSLASNNTQPQRQALVKIAYEGLYYFLYQAFRDPTFRTKLTTEERQMLVGLEAVLEQAHALRWFKENKITHFEKLKNPKVYTFAYADMKNEVVQLDTLTLDAPVLIFTTDRERFKELKPGEPERTAKTFADFSKAIEINLLRLNDPETKFDLGNAVSLLVHEYGHKLDKLKNQTAVDSLAIKMGDFIRSRITTHETSPGLKVYSLFFKNFDFGLWLDYGLFRGLIDFKTGIPRLEKSNLPKNRLPVFNGQGFYLWSEFNNEYTDLTKDFLKKVTKKHTILREHSDERYYQFVDQVIYNLDSFEAIATPENPQLLKFKFNLAQIGTQQPFMIPNVSPDPAQAELTKRYYFSQSPYYVEPTAGEITANYNGSLFSFKNMNEKSRATYFSVDGDIKLQAQRIENNKFIFELKIAEKPDARDNFFNRIVLLNACEVEIKIGHSTFLLQSVNYDSINHVFIFQLNDIEKINLKEFEISHVYLKKMTQNIVDNTFQSRLEIGLFESIKVPVFVDSLLATPPTTQVIELQSVQEPITHSKNVRLVIKSSEKIRSLGLKLSVNETIFSFLTAQDNNEIVYRKMTGNIQPPTKKVDVILDSTQFKQHQIGDSIVVEFNLNDVYSFSQVDTVEQSVNKHGIKTDLFKMNMINPTVQLEQVSILTNSLQTAQFELEKSVSIAIDSFKRYSTPLKEKYFKLFNAQLNENIFSIYCKKLFD